MIAHDLKRKVWSPPVRKKELLRLTSTLQTLLTMLFKCIPALLNVNVKTAKSDKNLIYVRKNIFLGGLGVYGETSQALLKSLGVTPGNIWPTGPKSWMATALWCWGFSWAPLAVLRVFWVFTCRAEEWEHLVLGSEFWFPSMQSKHPSSLSELLSSRRK